MLVLLWVTSAAGHGTRMIGTRRPPAAQEWSQFRVVAAVGILGLFVVSFFTHLGYAQSPASAAATGNEPSSVTGRCTLSAGP